MLPIYLFQYNCQVLCCFPSKPVLPIIRKDIGLGRQWSKLVKPTIVDWHNHDLLTCLSFSDSNNHYLTDRERIT